MDKYDSSTWSKLRKRYSTKIGKRLSRAYPSYEVPFWAVWMYRVHPADEQGMLKSARNNIARAGGFESRAVHVQPIHDNERRIKGLTVHLR